MYTVRYRATARRRVVSRRGAVPFHGDGAAPVVKGLRPKSKYVLLNNKHNSVLSRTYFELLGIKLNTYLQ